ncbi:MAG: hypothetical protein R3F65_20515 [bacterium]
MESVSIVAVDNGVVDREALAHWREAITQHACKTQALSCSVVRSLSSIMGCVALNAAALTGAIFRR